MSKPRGADNVNFTIEERRVVARLVRGQLRKVERNRPKMMAKFGDDYDPTAQDYEQRALESIYRKIGGDPDNITVMEPEGVQTFEVWSEGYAINSERGQAQLIGTVEAVDFAEACLLAAQAAEAEGRDYGEFSPTRLTLWGCRLFPTEAEARESFG